MFFLSWNCYNNYQETFTPLHYLDLHHVTPKYMTMTLCLILRHSGHSDVTNTLNMKEICSYQKSVQWSNQLFPVKSPPCRTDIRWQISQWQNFDSTNALKKLWRHVLQSAVRTSLGSLHRGVTNQKRTNFVDKCQNPNLCSLFKFFSKQN